MVLILATSDGQYKNSSPTNYITYRDGKGEGECMRQIDIEKEREKKERERERGRERERERERVDLCSLWVTMFMKREKVECSSSSKHKNRD